MTYSSGSEGRQENSQLSHRDMARIISAEAQDTLLSLVLDSNSGLIEPISQSSQWLNINRTKTIIEDHVAFVQKAEYYPRRVSCPGCRERCF